jgi:hypothetical protein
MIYFGYVLLLFTRALNWVRKWQLAIVGVNKIKWTIENLMENIILYRFCNVQNFMNKISLKVNFSVLFYNCNVVPTNLFFIGDLSPNCKVWHWPYEIN